MDRPIEVPATPARTQAATGARDLLLIVAALPALIAVLGTRDVIAIVRWLASEPGLVLVGAVIAVVTPIWRQWLARREHQKLRTLEEYAPSDVARVK